MSSASGQSASLPICPSARLLVVLAIFRPSIKGEDEGEDECECECRTRTRLVSDHNVFQRLSTFFYTYISVLGNLPHYYYSLNHHSASACPGQFCACLGPRKRRSSTHRSTSDSDSSCSVRFLLLTANFLLPTA